MKSIKASLSLLVFGAVFGSGCAMNEPARSEVAKADTAEITNNCAQTVRREIRGTYHPGRRTYTTVRTNSSDCNPQQ